MYVNKEFDNCVERELSKGLRSRLEDAEKVIREICCCHERVIALEKLDEAMMWANAAIAAAGVSCMKLKPMNSGFDFDDPKLGLCGMNERSMGVGDITIDGMKIVEGTTRE